MSALPLLDQFEFHHRLAAEPGPTLVMFSGPHCGGCRHLRRILVAVCDRRPDWRAFEVDAARDPALVHEFDVFHLPALFLFDAGRFYCELVAEAQVTSVIDATLVALQGPAQEAP